jgi:hypothetical protein
MEIDSRPHIELYLTKTGQNALKKREMIALMQLFRIINALRFQTSLLLHIQDEEDSVFYLRSELEIISVLAGSFKEATKEFYNNLFKVLRPLSDEVDLKYQIEKHSNRTRDYKNDEILNIIDYIRNNFSFHHKSELFKNYILDGDAKDDLLLGVAKSEKIKDWCFLKSYDALIFQVGNLATSLSDKREVPNWLFKEIFKEVDYFCDLLEKFAGSVVKKYGEKRLGKSVKKGGKK